MRLVNAYTIDPGDIQEGDVMLFVVKAMAVRPGFYRIYRCLYEGDDVPEGGRVIEEAAVCNAFFPSLAQVARPDPF